MPQTTTERMHRSFILGSLPWFIMAHFAHHLLTALPQPLLPAIRSEFHLNYTQASLVTTVFALAGGAAQLPSGWFADRFSPFLLIGIGTLGVAAGGILVGLSQTYVMLLVCLLLMGLMTGGYHPAATPLILASVKPEQRGKALGLHLIGGNSSFALAPLAAGPILALWGWRASFLCMAIPTAVFGLIFYVYLTRRSGRGHVEAARSRIASDKPPQPGYKRRLTAYLTQMVLAGGAGMTVNAFLSLYMVDRLGASNAKAAMFMSLVFIPGFFAPLIGGYISDRIGATKVVIATSLISGLVIFGINTFSLGLGFYAMLFIMGTNLAIRMPVTEVFIMSQTPAKHRSTIYGVYYFTMQYTGAIFAPIMGGLIQRYSFHTMFTFSAIAVTGISLVTSAFIWDAKA
ncbi:MAG: MFS transporter [Syntrophorhabdales bacterium]|jgi:MFS family permease